MLELPDPRVVSVVDLTSEILSESQTRELSRHLKLIDPVCKGAKFYYCQGESEEFIELRLVKVFKVPQVEAVNEALLSPVVAKDYSVFVFDGTFVSDNVKSSSVVRGQEVAIVSSFFGILSREIFRNAITKAVVSATFQGCISLLDCRYLPGACGGAVFSADLSSVVGIVLPSAIDYFTPMLGIVRSHTGLLLRS